MSIQFAVLSLWNSQYSLNLYFISSILALINPRLLELHVSCSFDRELAVFLKPPVMTSQWYLDTRGITFSCISSDIELDLLE